MGFAHKKHTGMFALLSCITYCLSGAYGNDNCDGHLVSGLPQASFNSSSQLSSIHGPGFAKLNRRDGAGGWSPLESNKYQWLQIDFGQRTDIRAIATQGRYGSSDWVTSYLLMFSDSSRNWKQYRQEGSTWGFVGNSNADSVVQYRLQQPVIARFLRFAPLQWNPNGRIGLRVEVYGCSYKSDVASFDGSSSLLYRFNQKASQTTKDVISVKFKTVQNSGIIVHGRGQHGDILTLELLDGKLRLKIGKKSSSDSSVVLLGSLLDDQHWHYVAIEYIEKSINFTVDRITHQFEIKGDSTDSDTSNELSFGGAPDYGKLETFSGRNFQGCLENLLYNDVNVIDFAKQNNQVSVRGNVTFACSEPPNVPVTFMGTKSYLQLSAEPDKGGLSVSLQFRTWDKEGLLITTELHQNSGTLWLYIREGKIRLQIDKAGRIVAELTAGSNLNDGQWHSVDFNAVRGLVRVTVDRDIAHANSPFHVSSGNNYFFGGCPEQIHKAECRNPYAIFQGCMRLISIGNNVVDLTKVQQTFIGNFSDLQMDTCGIIDRCLPNYCEHKGRCSQTWNMFSCNCSDSGYTGATCHSSVYEQSCEAYKHRGNTSGFYHVDADGSGPLGPRLVFCNMTDKAWTVIQHNNTELIQLKSYKGTNHRSACFNYTVNTKELGAIINQAEHCEQRFTYYCKQPLLLNSPDGAQFSWWVGRRDKAQMHWSGGGSVTQTCSCGLRETCVHPDQDCTCDPDGKERTNDSGLLSFKDHLPITEIAFGDLSRAGSEAAFKVGHLQCHGDKNFWNSAFFNKETSYLHFPTFHGELSADISFLFKTTASSGVFLENLGIKDFIRIELSSQNEVLFSYDVGNGPFEMRVETRTPLNDNQWHHVKAERNLKEASLRVDQLPSSSQEAPIDGHIHLQLNSQLFVGGTASRQKGFLGCIRSLQLNGVTLDLEERARITPGVSPGCPGHCSTYGSLCQNGGKCMEKYAGFSCDCSASAFTGPFCTTEVSGYFEPGTSVTYYLKELNENSSAQPAAEMNLRGESVSFSFRTTQSPALLLYVSSDHREYIAALLNRYGHLNVIYKLQDDQDAEVFQISQRNMANGLLHTVNIGRESEILTVQIDQFPAEEFTVISDVELNSIKSIVLGKILDAVELDPAVSRINVLGFSGCISAVRFNSLAPLKTALLRPAAGNVAVVGQLRESHCGSPNPFDINTIRSLSDHSGTKNIGEPIVDAIRSESALIGGVIAVTIFVLICALAIMVRFLYRIKESFQSRSRKGVKADASARSTFNNDPNPRNILSETQKEYFI
ncbi:contactin-associated protein-like 5 [Conger conger]|uniref:contactin-associated protein-like 5 n=1 Tax=Conger conger TaxID=82655 RepID=UPI002A5A77FC|nr:contactin-associated protein-like 5 [Conger conger]